MATKKQLQFQHIRENSDLFDELQCGLISLGEYWSQYYDESGPDGLYLGLCSDMGIKPRAEALHDIRVLPKADQDALKTKMEELPIYSVTVHVAGPDAAYEIAATVRNQFPEAWSIEINEPETES